MTDDVRRGASGGQRGGRPELPSLLIPDVIGFASRVGNGVIAPRCQSEFVAVFDPGLGAATLRDNRPEEWVGQHVDPGSGSHLIRRQGNDVFASIAGEAAQAVVKNEVSFR